MKEFRTIVTPGKSPFGISHTDKLVVMGSCFSENIGKKFKEYKFKCHVNPFGQQYNPYSISAAILRLLRGQPYTESELVMHNELFHSFDHHGSYSRATAAETLQAINSNFTQAAEDLKQATVLLLTFGTAHVFSLKETGNVVSNCHKLSGSVFDKRLMPPAEIAAALEDALMLLRVLNPSVKIILTVSPVRYFAFGHYENSVSKAHLFTAIHELQQRLPDVYYFPAYELVMDDLRDYRFFADDMLHPNYQATQYVWDNLCQTCFSKKTTSLLKEIDEVLMAAKHRPRNPGSEAHKEFVTRNLDKIKLLENQFGILFTEEENKLKQGNA